MEVDGDHETLQMAHKPTINDLILLPEIRWIESIMETKFPSNQVIKVIIIFILRG